MIACAFTIQASAQSGDVKYEDFITDPLNITPGVLDNGFRYYLCNNFFLIASWKCDLSRNLELATTRAHLAYRYY